MSLQVVDLVRENARASSVARHHALIDSVTDKVFGTGEQPRMTTLAERIRYESVVLPQLPGLTTATRRSLAVRLTSLAEPPMGVLLALARSELPVAAIVLSKSPALGTELLAELCVSLPGSHLAPIAQRTDITTAMTTRIALRGTSAAHVALLCNTAVTLSERALLALAGAAERDLVLYKRMTTRLDLPQALRDAIVPMTTPAVRPPDAAGLARSLINGTATIDDAIILLARADAAFGIARVLLGATGAPLPEVVTAVCGVGEEALRADILSDLSLDARQAVHAMRRRRHGPRADG